MFLVFKPYFKDGLKSHRKILLGNFTGTISIWKNVFSKGGTIRRPTLGMYRVKRRTEKETVEGGILRGRAVRDSVPNLKVGRGRKVFGASVWKGTFYPVIPNLKELYGLFIGEGIPII